MSEEDAAGASTPSLDELLRQHNAFFSDPTLGPHRSELMDRALLTLSARRLPDILHHYTSLDGFQAIVRSGNVWATNATYLNDAAETRVAAEALDEHLKSVRDDTLTTESHREIARMLLKRAREIPLQNTYVASFSTERDQLSQWRGYCRDGGVSLGFSVSTLIQALIPFSGAGVLAPAIYHPEEQLHAVVTFVDALAQFHATVTSKQLVTPEVALEECFQAAQAHLPVLGAMFKHWKFGEESEWRLVVHSVNDDDPRILTRVVKRTLVPYIEIPFAEPGSVELEGVTVGPTPHPRLTARAIVAFFHHKPVAKHVVGSDVPYRDW